MNQQATIKTIDFSYSKSCQQGEPDFGNVRPSMDVKTLALIISVCDSSVRTATILYLSLKLIKKWGRICNYL